MSECLVPEPRAAESIRASELPDIDLGLPGERAATRVVVAMSGGVDSSVVAGLLARSGYEVVGITLQLYDQGAALPRKGACCAGADVLDAKRGAAKLGIPHYLLDYEARFAERVINPFAESYLRGETPIPCVACNQTVKFEDLLSTARDLGATALATGHYVESRLEGNRQALYRAADASRDQSYFLFATTQDQLDFLRFPLGGMPKSKVRDLALALDLSVADKPDSQDICFVPEGNYADLIRKLRPEATLPGPIVDLGGKVLGEHEGLVGFTIGQRRGLGIAAGEPLFVIQLNPERNEVVVGPREALKVFDVKLRDINWLGDGSLEEAALNNMPIWARVRSTRPPIEAFLAQSEDGHISVRLLGGEEGVAPGQACVFYESEATQSRVLGGGWITR